MSETDFSREHAERAEAQRFELEKMRARRLIMARVALIESLRRWGARPDGLPREALSDAPRR
jgi:hypothetical protein